MEDGVVMIPAVWHCKGGCGRYGTLARITKDGWHRGDDGYTCPRCRKAQVVARVRSSLYNGVRLGTKDLSPDEREAAAQVLGPELLETVDGGWGEERRETPPYGTPMGAADRPPPIDWNKRLAAIKMPTRREVLDEHLRRWPEPDTSGCTCRKDWRVHEHGACAVRERVIVERNPGCSRHGDRAIGDSFAQSLPAQWNAQVERLLDEYVDAGFLNLACADYQRFLERCDRDLCQAVLGYDTLFHELSVMYERCRVQDPSFYLYPFVDYHSGQHYVQGIWSYRAPGRPGMCLGFPVEPTWESLRGVLAHCIQKLEAHITPPTINVQQVS